MHTAQWLTSENVHSQETPVDDRIVEITGTTPYLVGRRSRTSCIHMYMLCFCCQAAVSKEQKPVKPSPSQKALIKEKKKQDRLVARQAKKDELKRKADEDRAKKKEVCCDVMSLTIIFQQITFAVVACERREDIVCM